MTLRNPGKVILSASNTPPLLVRKFPSDVSIQSMRFSMAVTGPIGPVFGGSLEPLEVGRSACLPPGRARALAFESSDHLSFVRGGGRDGNMAKSMVPTP